MEKPNYSKNPVRDPHILDPEGMTAEDGWKECKKYIEQCGGIANEDGTPNWRAAFGADPGICSCPHCRQKYWAFGNLIKCTCCDFEFPPNWWLMYSRGCGTRKREILEYSKQQNKTEALRRHAKRMENPYYRYGFENPAPDPARIRFALPWKTIVNGAKTNA